jgi:hypothetical protein
MPASVPRKPHLGRARLDQDRQGPAHLGDEISAETIGCEIRRSGTDWRYGAEEAQLS